MRAFILAVVVAATVALAASVSTLSHSGSSAVPTAAGDGIAVSAATQTALSVQVAGTAITSASLVAWCYSNSTWGRLPAYDLNLTLGPQRVAGRATETPDFLAAAPLPAVPASCSRLYWQTIDIRPSGLSHTVRVSITAGSADSTCSSLSLRVLSCGTTALAVPTSRAAGSTSLEIINSPENVGTPKVKCLANPSDGGVGFGATYPGLVRSPGESMFFNLDGTNTVMCICDTPATSVQASECIQ